MQQSNHLIVSELCEGEIKVVSGFSYGDCEMSYVTVFCDHELLWLHIAKGDVELRIYCMTMYWPMSPVFEFVLWLYGPDVEWGLVCKCSRAGVYYLCIILGRLSVVPTREKQGRDTSLNSIHFWQFGQYLCNTSCVMSVESICSICLN